MGGEYMGTVRLNDAEGVLAKYVDGKLRTSSMPYLTDIAEGNVSGHFAARRDGINEDVGVAWETLTAQGDLQIYLDAAETLQVSSSSTDDDVGGTGATELFIQGLDTDYALQNELVVMDGQTAVETSKSYLRIFLARVTDAGADDTNAGTISIKDNSDTDTLLAMHAEEGQTHSAIFTVPDDDFEAYYITHWYGSEGSTKGSEIALFIKPFGEVFQLKRSMVVKDSNFDIPFTIPLRIPAKSDIEIRAKGVLSGAFVSGGFEGWYEW